MQFVQGISHLGQGSHTKPEGIFVLEASPGYVATGEAQAHSKAGRDRLWSQMQLQGRAPNAAVPGSSAGLGWQRGPVWSKVWSGCTEKQPKLAGLFIYMDLSKPPPREAMETLANNGSLPRGTSKSPTVPVWGYCRLKVSDILQKQNAKRCRIPPEITP